MSDDHIRTITYWWKRAKAAETALGRVRALHRRAASPVVGDYCADCDIEWPYPTISILDKEDA